MRRFALALVLSAAASQAQSTLTTITGTIRDLTGATATSGQISFKLNAPDATIPGVARFSARTAYCGINATGNPVSLSDGVSACTITSNTAISPTNTSYTVCVQPAYASPGGCFNFFALAGQTVDISTIAPTPTQLPTNYAGVQGPRGPQGPQGISGSGLAPFTSSSATNTGTVLLTGSGSPVPVFTTTYPTGSYPNAVTYWPGPITSGASLATPYFALTGTGTQQYASVSTVNQWDTGYNQGTAAAETRTPFYWGMSNYYNGFGSLMSMGISDFSANGDRQYIDFSVLERSGCIDPSCEGHHRWRTEHQQPLPYYGFASSQTVDGNGHPVLNLTVEYNPQTLVSELPLLDKTALRSDTVTAATTSGGGNLTTSLLTVAGTYTASTIGTLAAAIDAGSNLISSPAQVTALINWTGPALTTSTRMVLWPTSNPNNGDSHPPEVVWPSAAPVNNGNGTWSVPMEILHRHDANDNVSAFGEAGNFLECTDKTYGWSTGGLLLNPYVEIILTSATHTLQTAYPLTGAMGTIGHVSPIHIYSGATVIDPHPQSGTQATLEHTTFAPPAGHELFQPSNIAQSYFDELDNEQILDPYGAWVWKQLNMQNSVIAPANSALFAMATPNNLSGFVFKNQAGPFLSLSNEPTAQQNVNASNIGDPYIIGVQLTSNPYCLFETTYSTGGQAKICVNPFTQRATLPAADFSIGPLTTSQSGQVGGLQHATGTATGSGTTITFSTVTGIIYVGDILSGTGIPFGTQVYTQLTGATGKAGSYQTSVATTASSATVTSTSLLFSEYARKMYAKGAAPVALTDAYEYIPNDVSEGPVLGWRGYLYGPAWGYNNSGVAFSPFALPNVAFANSLHDTFADRLRGAGYCAILNDTDTACGFRLGTVAGIINVPLFTPANSAATCTTGDHAADTNYEYVCTATNTWKRVALAAF